jgi:hypothetical protein
VAVLSDDIQRAASEILRLIFCRWIQENDFKYLDKHFGINQITSYGVVRYEELADHVEDRLVRSRTAVLSGVSPFLRYWIPFFFSSWIMNG